MRSISSLIPLVGLGLTTLLQLSSAAPVDASIEDRSFGFGRGCSQPKVATPTLPVNGGPTELPAPTTAFRFVGVGRGVQNYTCSGVGATPVAIGAVATLFDGTRLAETVEEELFAIPNLAVFLPIPEHSFRIPMSAPLGILGNHFFAADGTPVFNLTSVDSILFGKKIADIPAPSDAVKGPGGIGAVDWLTLSDKGGSKGVSSVYRVITAGGSPPKTCTSKNSIIQQYSALYFFFQ
ncbi:hypothetical protein F5884DRAFT_67096 [Xylogone sp. PMI_703]|nr:hypothetical protein F5884DRAFT_67096 [Xylogone sp. PMI_703]